MRKGTIGMAYKVILFATCLMLSVSPSVFAQEQPTNICPNPLPNEAGLDAIIACVQSLQRESVPSGAVVAFDRPEGCPDGWADMGQVWRGRTLVAAVSDTNDTYGFRRSGGEESVKLEPWHLPPHSHSMTLTGRWGDQYGGPHGWGHDAGGQPPVTLRTSNGDGLQGEAHYNMPPYIALYYCKKD